MAEDGIDDFALAKRKAAKQLGAVDAQALPGNDEIEAELRAYLALYQAEEHPQRVVELREIALDAMRALERFNPYLTGPVLKGIAGPYAEIELQLFPDSVKEVEIFLLDRNLTYATQEGRRYAGDRAHGVSATHAVLARRAASALDLRRARRAPCAEDLAGGARHGPCRHCGGRRAAAR